MDTRSQRMSITQKLRLKKCGQLPGLGRFYRNVSQKLRHIIKETASIENSIIEDTGGEGEIEKTFTDKLSVKIVITEDDPTSNCRKQYGWKPVFKGYHSP